MKIYLASTSPRRRELLMQIGLEFEVMISNVQEKITAARPGKVVEELSEQKAMAVFRSIAESEKEVLVIGADTVVAVGSRILGKPADIKEATEMLEMLSDNTHQVYTGVTLCYKNAEKVQKKTFHERTNVTFYPMSDKEISRYVSTRDCMDKAGAYGIQGFCARYIREIEGDYNNVVGLPVGRLYQEAKEFLGE